MAPIRPTFLILNAGKLREFRLKNAGLVQAAEDLLWYEWQISSMLANLEDQFTVASIVGVQQLHEYHRQSCLLSIQGAPNIGLALTRMGCELSRDILKMARDKELEELWWRSRSGQSSDFRKTFRFDDNPAERGLFSLYNITSSYGVHGHILPGVEGGSFTTENGKEFKYSRTDPLFIAKSFGLNLSSVQLFLQGFLIRHGEAFKRAEDEHIGAVAASIARAVSSIRVDFGPAVSA